MLKHYPKLNKLWNKAKKIKEGELALLDMRTNEAKNFAQELNKILQEQLKVEH